MSEPKTDMADRVCVVTGANTGVGKAIALGLSARKATVLMACRDAERGEAARKEIMSATSNPRVELGLVDLSSQASIRAYGKAVGARYDRLHVLVNNAAVWPTRRRSSPDGIELTWATNVLGYFLLTQELLPLLEAGAPARIVSVASRLAHSLDLSDVELQRRGYDGTRAYAQSKQANRMWTWELARRLAGTGVTANALHPGTVSTEIARDHRGPFGALSSMWFAIRGRAPAAGADTALWLAWSAEVEGTSGRYFRDRRERPCRFRNAEQQLALWQLCERMTREPRHARPV